MSTAFFVFVVLAAANCAPPTSWREHWFEHRQNLARVFIDNDLALYFDSDMKQSVTWPRQFLGDVWRYAKRIYGSFGPESHLYAIFHARKVFEMRYTFELNFCL